ncbi:recombinase [Gallibacterium genomosp. 3]|uniref:Recombinase n=1 Tax=Gallibacterium genomosp. 3 TaxID=505345 RepID=A0A1A7PVN5_9PAST|nr:recombination protein NinB [Gallibacterium genomosp. 3]OBX05782.1 recombinase [Gallibacterium genomosp. 3]
MEHKQRCLLRNEQVRNNSLNFIRTLPIDAEKTLVIEIKPMTRTLEQNAKLHAMLGDIAKQCEFQGKKRDIETWKMIMVSAHKIASGGQAEMAIGLEGEVINLRESTAKMSVKRLASLIEYITAWGVANGVQFKDNFNLYLGEKR